MSSEIALALHVLRLVLDRLGATGTEAVPVGGVYLVDRLGEHGYAALRRRKGRGRDLSVLLVRPRPRRCSVELQLRVAPSAAKKLAKEVLGHRARAMGAHSVFDVTRSSHLDRLADEIARLARKT